MNYFASDCDLKIA